ncbi:MAG: hypothetical protein RLZZ616_265 [Pseudomonadota bacterium]
MIKGIFNLTLRATQGLLDSLFELMNMPLCALVNGCVSNTTRTRQKARRSQTHLTNFLNVTLYVL